MPYKHNELNGKKFPFLYRPTNPSYVPYDCYLYPDSYITVTGYYYYEYLENHLPSKQNKIDFLCNAITNPSIPEVSCHKDDTANTAPILFAYQHAAPKVLGVLKLVDDFLKQFPELASNELLKLAQSNGRPRVAERIQACLQTQKLVEDSKPQTAIASYQYNQLNGKSFPFTYRPSDDSYSPLDCFVPNSSIKLPGYYYYEYIQNHLETNEKRIAFLHEAITNAKITEKKSKDYRESAPLLFYLNDKVPRVPELFYLIDDFLKQFPELATQELLQFATDNGKTKVVSLILDKLDDNNYQDTNTAEIYEAPKLR